MNKINKRINSVIFASVVFFSCFTAFAASNTLQALLKEDISSPIQSILQPKIQGSFGLDASHASLFHIPLGSDFTAGTSLDAVRLNIYSGAPINGECVPDNFLNSHMLWNIGSASYVVGSSNFALMGTAVYNKMSAASRAIVGSSGCLSFQVYNSSSSLSNLCTGQGIDCTSVSGACVANPSAIDCAVSFQVPYMYVVESGSKQILKCQINSSGTFSASACAHLTVPFGLLSTPQGIAIDQKGTFAYIGNNGLSGGAAAFCAVDNSSGDVNGCQTVNGAVLSTLWNVAVHPSNQWVYFTNTVSGLSSSTVIVCQVNQSTGNLSGCAGMGSSLLAATKGIAISPDGTRLYFYAQILGGAAVRVCTISSADGTLANCMIASNFFGSPIINGMAFDAAGTHVYLADLTTPGVRVCSVNPSTGVFSSCSTTAGLGMPYAVTLDPANKLLYVADFVGSKIYSCTVNTSTGAISGCADSGAVVSGPASLAIKLG